MTALAQGSPRADGPPGGWAAQAYVAAALADLTALRTSADWGWLEVSQPRPEALDVTWSFKAGRLRFVANFGEAEVVFERGGDRIVWASRLVEQEADRLRLPAWTGAVLRSEPA